MDTLSYPYAPMLLRVEILLLAMLLVIIWIALMLRRRMRVLNEISLALKCLPAVREVAIAAHQADEAKRRA